MMKKWILFILLFVVIGISSCLKSGSSVTQNCSPVTVTAPASEVAALKMYIDTNHIVATQDSRGFFYTIDSSIGSGTARPTICSAVSATYIGTYLNGKVFDSSLTNPASFSLNGVITGWGEAVPLMRLNESMTLYLPPTLAYGAAGYGPIPGNSYLRFNIKLLAFN